RKRRRPGRRQRLGNSRGRPRADLRSVFHDETGGPGDGARPRHRAAARIAQRGRNRRRIKTRENRVQGGAPDRRQPRGRSAVVSKPFFLVVDDDAQVLAAVRRDLRARYRETYTIVSATSG